MSAPTWIRYRTGTWHAYRPGEDRPICRSRAPRPARDGRPEPKGRPCRTCRRRFDHAPRRPPAYLARRPHAEDYLADLRGSIRRAVCACVRKWPEARPVVEEAERHVLALLLAWEAQGTTVAARDVEAAGAALTDAWREAAERYELLDGSHPYEERRRP